MVAKFIHFSCVLHRFVLLVFPVRSDEDRLIWKKFDVSQQLILKYSVLFVSYVVLLVCFFCCFVF